MKLTEEQIEKAFECCEANDGEHPNCCECPYLESGYANCCRELRAQALNLLRARKAKIDDLEKELAVHKGAMRAYQEACEKAHDEAVADFSHFLIDKAKDGSIEICDLPDLVAEWRSPERKDAELMKDVNAAFDKAAEGMELSSKEKNKESWLRTATGWYDARFRKVE